MNTFWKVFIGLLAIGVIVSLVTLFNDSRPIGSENLVSKPLPDFAAPLASGSQNGDSNIYTPAQAKAARSVAACDVELPGVFNSCRDLTGSSIVLFWNTGKTECVAQVDALNGFLAANPKVDGVAVAFDQKESAVREFASGRGWRLPLAIDRDGAVAGLYAVAGCPSTFFVRDGTVTAVRLGELSQQQLAAGVKRRAGATGVTN